ncbi:thiopurine S-methyltransferase [Allochromatium vinosum]|uniref:Thiopurine S-methyltransferase n=1 Tax=Allochromatium vinosum (strain ATCC 17899 / DSM 180 / NBRC 103801 / NCIMB 10441 / D) TaxID=572477 RepID=D3RTH2_ALLVD|nr:thiopurine S-methyltransferase [Allochromatium vinosum]ADC62481.1 Thiopurine S-methyltransferase [Allochromatium vinosum DSM 180]
MDTQFWLDRWDRRETGWHLGEINSHLQEHWPKLGLAHETRVFVPLCGKTLDLVWLVSRGHRVVGVELSRLGIEAFLAEHRLEPRITEQGAVRRYQVDELVLFQGDFFDLRPEHLDDVGAVFDRASLIALPPPMRVRYAEHLRAILPRPVDRLLITLDYDQAQMSGPPFSVQPPEIERLFGVDHHIEPLAEIDALAESPNFRQRGLTALVERVHWLRPRV